MAAATGPSRDPPVIGAEEVARVLVTRAPLFAPLCRPTTVNGGPGIIVGPPERVIAVVGLTVVQGRVREIDIIGDRAKLGRLAFSEPS